MRDAGEQGGPSPFLSLSLFLSKVPSTLIFHHLLLLLHFFLSIVFYFPFPSFFFVASPCVSFLSCGHRRRQHLTSPALTNQSISSPSKYRRANRNSSVIATLFGTTREERKGRHRPLCSSRLPIPPTSSSSSSSSSSSWSARSTWTNSKRGQQKPDPNEPSVSCPNPLRQWNTKRRFFSFFVVVVVVVEMVPTTDGRDEKRK